MRRLLMTAGALGLLAGAAADAAPARRVTLRYAATDPSRYVIRTDQLDRIEAADGVAETRVSHLLQESRREVVVDEDGTLRVHLEAGRVRARVDGEPVTPGAPESFRPVGTYRVSGTGAPLPESSEEEATETDGPRLLALPIRPVRVGDTWATTLPAGDGRPFPLHIEHRVETLGVHAGTLHARIESRAHAEAGTDATDVRIDYQARLLFDVEAGAMRRSETVLRVRTRHAASNERPAIVTERRHRRRVALRDPAPVALD